VRALLIAAGPAAGVAVASRDTHISGPKDCRKLDVTPNLDATF